MEISELKTVHQGRGVIYAVASRFYLFAPEDEHYNMLKDVIEGVTDVADEASNNTLKDGVNALKIFIEKLSTLKAGELEEFKLENKRNYTTAFCLDATAPISESYYTSKEKLIMQESRDDVLRWFKKYGFKMNINSNEPEDHLGCELMFLAHLSDRLSEVADLNEAKKIVEDQSKFIKEHLINWLPMFIERLIKLDASHNFYLPLTYFVFGFLEEDLIFLDEIK